jgi:hypothetical protein
VGQGAARAPFTLGLAIIAPLTPGGPMPRPRRRPMRSGVAVERWRAAMVKRRAMGPRVAVSGVIASSA